MKIYIPFCGVGFGHASRCLALAEGLKKKGYDVFLSTHKPVYDKIKKSGIKVFKTGKEFEMFQDMHSFNPFKSVLDTLLKTEVPKTVRIQYKTISKIKPDVVVSDGYFSVLPVTKFKKIPLFFLTNQTKTSSFFPGYANKPVANMIDFLIKLWVEESEKVIIPDFPKPHTICRNNIKFFGTRKKFEFVGPLIRKYPKEVKGLKYRKKTILVSTGGGIKADISMLKHVKRSDIQFIVFGARREKRKGNIIMKRFTFNFFPYLKNADAMITHGGHTTLMECCVYGTPVIGIPTKGFVERENNLRGMRKYGLGVILNPDDAKKKLEEKIEEVLDTKYKRNMKIYQKLGEKCGNINKIAGLF